MLGDSSEDRLCAELACVNIELKKLRSIVMRCRFLWLWRKSSADTAPFLSYISTWKIVQGFLLENSIWNNSREGTQVQQCRHLFGKYEKKWEHYTTSCHWGIDVEKLLFGVVLFFHDRVAPSNFELWVRPIAWPEHRAWGLLLVKLSKPPKQRDIVVSLSDLTMRSERSDFEFCVKGWTA